MSFVNLSIAIDTDNDDILKPLLLTASIFPENETSVTVCKAICDTMKEKALYLSRWALLHESMFGATHDIPSSTELTIGKLGQGGAVTTDTCNAARKLSSLLVDEIIEQGAKDQGITVEDSEHMVL